LNIIIAELDDEHTLHTLQETWKYVSTLKLEMPGAGLTMPPISLKD
jgi:hypothetical protein